MSSMASPVKLRRRGARILQDETQERWPAAVPQNGRSKKATSASSPIVRASASSPPEVTNDARPSSASTATVGMPFFSGTP